MVDNIQFQQIVKSQMENWLNDKIIIDNCCGDETEIKRDFLRNISAIINIDFVILTDEELMDKMMGFHDSMEGIG